MKKRRTYSIAFLIMALLAANLLRVSPMSVNETGTEEKPQQDAVISLDEAGRPNALFLLQMGTAIAKLQESGDGRALGQSAWLKEDFISKNVYAVKDGGALNVIGVAVSDGASEAEGPFDLITRWNETVRMPLERLIC